MRFMGADLSVDPTDGSPRPGRAVVRILDSDDLVVRFIDAAGHLVKLVLRDTSPDAKAILGSARSIVVLVASHRDDLARAQGAGMFEGWVAVAESSERDDEVLGYAVGVGVQS